MAIVNLRPSADGTHAGWSQQGGSAKWSNVRPGEPLSHDDATTFIQVLRVDTAKYSAAVGDKPAMAAVNGLKAGLRAQTQNNTNTAQVVNLFARLSSTDGADLGFSGFGAWVSASPTAIARPGGGSWTPADIESSTLELGTYVSTWEPTNPGEVNVTSMWYELDYDPAPGFLVFAIASILPPLVGGLLLREMPALSAELWRRRRIRLTSEELERAWREWRAARWPVRWFLGPQLLADR